MDVLERIENGEVSVVVGIRIGMAISPERELRDEIIDLAKLGKRMQWVSVEEQMPKEEDVILAWVGTVCVRACLGKTPYGVAWYLVDRSSYINIHNVTHWMPLPPNPGEED